MLKASRRKVKALPTHLVTASVNLRKATATSNTLHRPLVIWFTTLHAPSHRLATAGNRQQKVCCILVKAVTCDRLGEFEVVVRVIL